MDNEPDTCYFCHFWVAGKRGVATVGQVLRQPGVAESEGWQNEYFKWKKYIDFLGEHVLNDGNK